MIPQNYILDLKKDTMFQQIKEGIINKHISDVLLGKKGYAMSWLPIPTNTEPNIIIIVLHILVEEGVIDNKVINDTFISIEINEENVCLLLGYVKALILYKKLDNILNIDYNALYNRIINKKDEFKNLWCYNHFLPQVENLIQQNEK